MFRTFFIGVVLGAATVAAILHLVPAVDQGRERSMISVQANGGNRESFHVNLPADRIMAGSASSEVTIPPGLEWPDYLNLADSQTELFKLRNDAERVIGIASRIAAGSNPRFVEWALHLPARGTLYLHLAGAPSREGARSGTLRAGTREFSELRGSAVERYVRNVPDGDEGYDSRLELVTALVGPDAPLAEIAEDER